MSNASPTPAGGWYADPMDAAQLRWWDGANWSHETMPAPVAPVAQFAPAATVDEPYVPPNSVFRIAENADHQAYVPEWSGFGDITPEIALSGVPVQLALESGSSEPPIPVSAAVFPILGVAPVEPAKPATAPPWTVEAPLAAPIEQLFPRSGPSATPPTSDAPAAVFPQVATPPPAIPEPAVPQSAVPQPSGELFPGLVPSEPVAPPDFQPFARSTPGASYEPLVAPVIPQPIQLSAPTPASAAPASWPSQQYQPNPGEYVPFDPKAVHLEPAPIIPFSSRDPFNAASTARPGLRSYGSAPIGPSGSTYTGALWMILLGPVLIAAGHALQFQLLNTGIGTNLVLAGIITAVWFVSIGAAQFDRNALARRGYFDLASPFWILLSPIVYLAVRASRVSSQGKGGGVAVGLWFVSTLLSGVIFAATAFMIVTAATPERVSHVESVIAQQFAAKNVPVKVVCPSVPSFASGTVFNCTATSTVAATSGQAALVQVTVTDWEGDMTFRVVSSAAGTTT